MVKLVLESEQHFLMLEELRQLFKDKMDDGSDPDIFMNVCLRYSLAYHQEFLDKQSIRLLVEQSIQEAKTSEVPEAETVYH